MNKRKIFGTTLVELLVVIVVFAVGILAFVQIFPGGLGVLRDSRAMTVARLMVRAESQRVAGTNNQTPEYISPVTYLPGGVIIPNANVDPNDLMPPLNDPGTGEGRLGFDGQILVGGNPIGQWSKVSATNKISRVLGEGRTVPAPSPGLAAVDPSLFGGLMHLTFGPIYYYRNGGTGIGEPGLLLGYTDDFEVRPGDRNAGYPDPVAGLYEPWVVHYVEAGRSTDVGVSPFSNQDQVWFNRLVEGGTDYRHNMRLQMTFLYESGGEVRPIDVVAPLVYADLIGAGVLVEVNGYSVISVPQLVDLIYPNGGVYRGLVLDSFRLQRQYQEVPLGALFTTDPLEFKVLNGSVGSVVINPAASAMRIPQTGGQERAMSFRTDYTVYDWRILKDEFTVPELGATSTVDVKLVLNSIRPSDSQAADGKPWTGMGDGTLMMTPGANQAVGSQDFVLVDVATGGIVLGNTNTVAGSAYFVDKSEGYVNFRDTDGNPLNGITGSIAFPDPANPDQWTSIQTGVQLNGRKMRALYTSNDDLAIQVLKPYSSYNVVQLSSAVPVEAGQVYVGGSGGWGLNNRLYFPMGDVGHKITVGEIVDSTGQVYREQQYQIERLEAFGGNTYAVVELPFAVANTPGVIPVRRVTGASLRVRAVWNSNFFFLGPDEVQNYDALRDWAKYWKTVDTETFLGAK